jgi:hypothetical protein
MDSLWHLAMTRTILIAFFTGALVTAGIGTTVVLNHQPEPACPACVEIHDTDAGKFALFGGSIWTVTKLESEQTVKHLEPAEPERKKVAR